MDNKTNKVVLAYSGGLDTSVILKWIKENQKRFITSCVIIALIIISVTGFIYWRDNRESAAMVAYYSSQGNQDTLKEISLKYGDTKAGKIAQLRLASLDLEQENFLNATTHADNFRGEVDLLLKADGLVLTRDADGVEATLEQWLRNPEEAQALGRRAREAIVASKGATERTFEVLRPMLDEVMARHAP